MLATVFLAVSAGMAQEYKIGEFKCQKGKPNDWHGYFACVPNNVCPDMKIRIDGKRADCNVKNAKEVLNAKANLKLGYALKNLPPFAKEWNLENLGVVSNPEDYDVYSSYYKLISKSNELAGYFVEHFYAHPITFAFDIRLVTRYNAEGKLAVILIQCGITKGSLAGGCPASLLKSWY